jgi:hypothetical protein
MNVARHSKLIESMTLKLITNGYQPIARVRPGSIIGGVPADGLTTGRAFAGHFGRKMRTWC